ncbi:GntR family transcriptional regulator [Saccharothrix sp. AJ9571]|nr:GntR family transcriptional regulator [Saccharothrix sp. AJ9571]
MSTKGLTGAPRQVIFGPLREGGRVAVVARRISQAIGLGLITDGEQLPSESALADSLKVSTVTLREALSSLREQGLLETRRGRGGGSFVRTPTEPSAARMRSLLGELCPHELREIGDHHVAVSGAAAKLAAERAGAEQLAVLGKLIGHLAAARTIGERRRADARFHVGIAAAARSNRLTRDEITLQGEVGELLWLPSGGDCPDLGSAVEQHSDILVAIESGAGHLARSRAEAHVDLGITRLIDLRRRLT